MNGTSIGLRFYDERLLNNIQSATYLLPNFEPDKVKFVFTLKAVTFQVIFAIQNLINSNTLQSKA